MTTEQTTTVKKPTHDVCHVKDGGKDSKGFWTTIGAAWMHEDQQGLNVMLDCIPTDGRLVIRIRKDKPAKAQ